MSGSLHEGGTRHRLQHMRLAQPAGSNSRARRSLSPARRSGARVRAPLQLLPAPGDVPGATCTRTQSAARPYQPSPTQPPPKKQDPRGWLSKDRARLVMTGTNTPAARAVVDGMHSASASSANASA